MKNDKGWIVTAAVLAAVVLIAGMSIGRAMSGGYAYNIFRTDWSSWDVSWGLSVGKKAELQNTIEIPLEKAELLDVQYSSENIYVYPTEGEKIVVKEYLRSDKEKDHAEVIYTKGNKAVITGRNKHYFYIFSLGIGNQEEHIDIYVPEQGMKELQLATSSGNIIADDFEEYVCDNLSLEVSSGNISWNRVRSGEVSMTASSGNVRAEAVQGNLEASTSSGNIYVERLTGKAQVSVSSGNISVDELEGCGDLHATSGNVRVRMTQVTGDIDMKASSGNVSLELPADVSFRFAADTSSGDIRTDFDDALSYNKKGNSASGDVGGNPQYKVSMRATSGSVKALVRDN